MASGTVVFVPYISGTYLVHGKIEWSSTVKSGNQSTLTAKLYGRRAGGDAACTKYFYQLTIDGSSHSGTFSPSHDSWELLKTVSVTIAHNADGKKTITLGGFVLANGGALSGYSSKGSGTATLDDIDRSTSLNSLTSNNGFLSGELTYKYTAASTSLYNQLTLSLVGGSTLRTIDLGKAGSYSQKVGTITLSADEIGSICSALPNASEATLRLTMKTYLYGSYTGQEGASHSKYITLTVDSEELRPDVTMSLSPEHSLPAAFSGVYVQGKSKVRAAITATAKDGAAIVSTAVGVGGQTYDEVSDYLGAYGNVTVTGYATDSRGLTGSISQEITVQPYIKPKILPATGETRVVIARCDPDGSLNDSGNSLLIAAKKNYASVNGINQCQVAYRYRPDSGVWSGWEPLEGESNVVLSGSLDGASAYMVELKAEDTIGESSVVSANIPTEKVLMHRDAKRNSVSIGGYIRNDNTFEVWEGMTASFCGPMAFSGEGLASLLNICHPVGSILQTVSNENPGNSIGGTWELIGGTTFQWERKS